MSEIIWSVNRDSKKLDKAGRANSTKFWFITRTQMTDTIQFEMDNNNFIAAAGKLWSIQGCIPMGGGGLSPLKQRTYAACGPCTNHATSSTPLASSVFPLKASPFGTTPMAQLPCASSVTTY